MRRLLGELPEIDERLSHGDPAWFIQGGRQVAAYTDHHHDDRVALWCAAPPGAQQAHVARDPNRYFRPPYVGHRGWLGVYLDVPVDWRALEEIIQDAYLSVAPARLRRGRAASAAPSQDAANVDRLRRGYEAFARGDLEPLLALIHPDLEWTFLDPGFPDPEPRTCRGRGRFRQALERRLTGGLVTHVEAWSAHDSRVLVVTVTPGLDQRRERKTGDRNFDILTFDAGLVTAIRACGNRAEAEKLLRLA